MDVISTTDIPSMFFYFKFVLIHCFRLFFSFFVQIQYQKKAIVLYNVEGIVRYHGGLVCTIPDGGRIYYLGQSLDGISVFVEYVQMQYHRDLVLACDPRHP